MSASKVLCILNGGYISTVSAALACQQFDEVHAITFNDGRQNQIDLESAISVADVLQLSSHEIIDLSPFFVRTPRIRAGYLLSQSRSNLTSNLIFSEFSDQDGINFISAKGILFLTVAASNAAVRGIKDILIEVCEEDCDRRQDFLDSITRVLSEGVWRAPEATTIHAPLIHLTKTKSLQLAFELLGSQFRDVFELTHDCSAGVEGGCGQCPACQSRDRTFHQAGLDDPIWKFRHPEFRSPALNSPTVSPTVSCNAQEQPDLL